jgi:peptide deformylase
MARMLKYLNGNLVEYEVFKLVDFYDPILRTPTEIFEFKDENSLKEASFLGYSMSETLQKLQGLGLSANQVGINKRLCVVNMGDKNWIMFNPKIVKKSEELSNLSEGCLSYPGLYLKVPRSNSVTVQFQAMNGAWVEQTVEGLVAVCIQHELDHLDGIMYTDRVSPIKLEQAKRKVKKTLKRMSQVTVEDLKRAGLA